MSQSPAYASLLARFTRLHRFAHLAAIAGWDQATMMPPKGNEARAAAQAELEVLMHATLTDPALAQELQQAEQEAHSEAERASLREMRREWQQANLLPAELVEAQALAGARCEHAWREQRANNDWTGFFAELPRSGEAVASGSAIAGFRPGLHALRCPDEQIRAGDEER